MFKVTSIFFLRQYFYLFKNSHLCDDIFKSCLCFLKFICLTYKYLIIEISEMYLYLQTVFDQSNEKIYV